MAIGGVIAANAAARSNTLAIVGDSYTSQSFNDSSTFKYFFADGYVTWALALSGQRLTPIMWAARGNSRVSAAANSPGVQFSDQVDQAIASGADHMLIMGGVNDAFAGFSVARITGAYDACLKKAMSAGLRIWACTQPTLNSSYASYTATVQATVFAVNEWLREYVGANYSRYGVTVVDLAAVAVDASNDKGDWRTNGSKDGLHPSNVGAYYMGKELARVWAAQVPEMSRQVSSAADNYTFSPLIKQAQTNGMFLTGSPVATGFTSTTITGATSTDSIVARSDGFGNDQQMILVSSANNDGWRLESTTVHANGFANGDTIQAEAEITVSGVTNYRGEHLQLIGNASVVNKGGFDGYVNTSTDKALPEGYTVVRRTPPIVLNGTPSSVRIRVDTNFSGIGGATVKVGRLSIRRLSSS